MYTIGSFEAKTHFSELLADVEKGEQIIITKHGHAVAKLSPIFSTDKQSVEEAITSIKEFQQHYTLGLDLETLRNEGCK